MSEDRNNGRSTDGRFSSGNPGRPRGAKHRTTRAIEALLEGEADALTRKAIEKALEGDNAALRLCLERLAPPRKDSPVAFELPAISSAADASSAMGSILAAVAAGDLTPAEASEVAKFLDAFRRTLEATELESRIAALEERHKDGK